MPERLADVKAVTGAKVLGMTETLARANALSDGNPELLNKRASQLGLHSPR